MLVIVECFDKSIKFFVKGVDMMVLEIVGNLFEVVELSEFMKVDLFFEVKYCVEVFVRILGYLDNYLREGLWILVVVLKEFI